MSSFKKIFIFLLILNLFADSQVIIDKLVGFIDQEPITLSDLRKNGIADGTFSLLKYELKRKGLVADNEEISFLAKLASSQDPRFPKVGFEDLEIAASLLKIFGSEIARELSEAKAKELAWYLSSAPSPDYNHIIALIKWVGEKKFLGNFYNGDRTTFLKEILPAVKEKELQDFVWEAVGGLPEGYFSVPFMSMDGSITIFEVAKRSRKLTVDENLKEMARAILAAEVLSEKIDFYRQKVEALLKIQVVQNF